MGRRRAQTPRSHGTPAAGYAFVHVPAHARRRAARRAARAARAHRGLPRWRAACWSGDGDAATRCGVGRRAAGFHAKQGL
jgi:hypothetical protein